MAYSVWFVCSNYMPCYQPYAKCAPLSLLSSLQTGFPTKVFYVRMVHKELKGVEMKQDAKKAFKKTSLGAKNAAYDIIAKLDPEYFEKAQRALCGRDFRPGRRAAEKTKEMIMIGITCALNRPRGVRRIPAKGAGFGSESQRNSRGRGGRRHPRRHAWFVVRWKLCRTSSRQEIEFK